MKSFELFFLGIFVFFVLGLAVVDAFAQTPDVSIISSVVTNSHGEPLSALVQDTTSYVTVVVDSTSRANALITVDLSDDEFVPLGIGSAKKMLPPGKSEIQISFKVKEDANIGNVKLFANVFSDWPSVNGVPLTSQMESTTKISSKGTVPKVVELPKMTPTIPVSELNPVPDYSNTQKHSSPKSQIISLPVGSSVPGCEETLECYLPYHSVISPGSSVTWNNDDTSAHTVTSGTVEAGPDGIFDSGLFMAGDSYTHIFNSVGSFDYFCIVHPWMIGKITVSGNPANVPVDKPVMEKPVNTKPAVQNSFTVASIETESSFFNLGEQVTVFGKISPEEPNKIVELNLISNGKEYASKKVVTRSTGTFEYDFKTAQHWDAGTFDVVASIERSKLTHSFQMISSSQSTPTYIPQNEFPSTTGGGSVQTDRSSYSVTNGSTLVQISGDVKSIIRGFPVTFEIQKSNGVVETFGSPVSKSGNFSLTYSLNTDDPSGTYWVTVIYNDAYLVRTSFSVVSNHSSPVTNDPDTDGDGIPDSSDSCPFDATNDRDGDGICSEVDSCPNEYGTQSNGCPPQDIDSDGDGVYDRYDSCPNEYGSSSGCPIDADGDGLYDNRDSCPYEYGTQSNGCPVDSDNDGVYDHNDSCPYEYGTSNGCPADVDGDGLYDHNDSCPYEYGTSNGCPIDSDGDGLYDHRDSCPYQYGTQSNGCQAPVDDDYDNDGVPNSSDSCPHEYGTQSNGCPAPVDDDYDNDGVPNSSDSCPHEYGTQSNGCPAPVDDDGDGIPNTSDSCPLDPQNDIDGDGVCGNVDSCPNDPGTQSNGCPAPVDDDGDGIPNTSDSCPLDPQNDIDGDGVCGNVDSCPNDPGTQSNGCPAPVDDDGDGIPNTSDSCPLDPQNDIDGDGVCGNVDSCPNDPGTQSNGCPIVSMTQFVNHGIHPIVSMTIDGVEQFTTVNSGIPAGGAVEGEFSPGTHQVTWSYGYWQGNQRHLVPDVPTFSDSWTQPSGQYHTEPIYDYGINEILTRFSSDGYWEMGCYDVHINLHGFGFVFYADGSYNFYQNGQFVSSGTYWQVSRNLAATTFQLSAGDQILLGEGADFFYINNNNLGVCVTSINMFEYGGIS